MRRRGRILLTGGALVALLLIALAGALGWLLTTADGFDWAVERARPYLPEGVTFARAEGRLVGPIELHELQVEGEGTNARIARARLQWHPLELLSGRLRIERLAVRGIDVQRSQEPDTARDEPPSLPRLPDRLRLPLPVTIDELAIDEVRVRGPDGTVQRLDRLRARLHAGPDELRLTDVAVAAPAFDADARVRLDMQAPYAIEGRVEWRARPPGPLAPMAGRLSLGGTVEDLHLVQEWSEPSEATVTADLRLFGNQPEWQARLELPRTMATRWWATAPELAATADLRLAGSLERASVSGTVDVDGLPVGPVRARVEAAADAERVALQRLHVEPARPDAWLRAAGEIALAAGGPRFDLTVDWHDLGWPLTGPRVDSVARSESGTLRIAGTADDYRLSGEGRAAVPAMEGEPARLAWDGAGSTTGLERLRLAADWRGARVEADGDVRWAEPGEARFELTARDVDPGWIDPSLEGQLEARARLAAEWHETVQAEVDLQTLTGTLNGRPVDGHARAIWRDDRVRLEAVRLAAGDARLRASGEIGGARLALDWNLRVPRLEQLLPRAAGRVRGQGSVRGDPAGPTMSFELRADGLRAAEVALDSMQLTGELTDGGRGRSRIALRVRGARTAGATIERLDADLRGTRAEHRLEVELDAQRGAAVVAIRGALEQGRWSGRLQRADLEPAGNESWRLAAPAALAWRADRFELEQACWTAGGARACARGAGRPGDWQVTLGADDVPVGLAAAHWRADLTYEGRFGLTATLGQNDGPVTGDARLELTPGRVRGVIGDTTTTLVDYGAGHLEAKLSADRVDAVVELPLAAGGRIAATAGIGRDQGHVLGGRLRAEVHDLGLVAVLVPAIGRAEGELRADLQLDGTLAAPRLSGAADLEAGGISVPRLGIELSALELGVETADRAFTVTASARSGEGSLSASMELAPREGAGWTGSGSLAGDDFTAVDLPEVHAVIAPDLAWEIEGRDIAVSGEVGIPSARIEPRDLSGTVQSSPDAVIVEDDGEPGAAPGDAEADVAGWRVSADVRVLIGDEVRINAFGLDADLGGDIRVVQRPGQLTNATGELRVVEGTYTIYRQTLTIERGRVLFASGPLSDPGLDIRAVRRPRDVLVGVNVRGTLREPRVELFSEPPMEESQVLSYLIVGVPLGETSGGERSSVSAAAAALASSRQGARIASELGIDEVTVEDDADTEGASLVLGRYLSPRLYIGYGIGLLEQADSVRMRYDLSRRWTVETRSGGTSSADLLFSIESD